MRLDGGILGRVDDMLIVRGVNVFPSAIENIVRSYAGVDEFQIEVYTRGALQEVRLLLELAGSEPSPRVVQERLRADLGIRVDVETVPPKTLPRYELKARRLVRRP